MTNQLGKLDEFILGNSECKYSEVFIEHALHPKNVGDLEKPTAFATASDHDGNTIEIWLQIDSDVITNASFWTDGCGTTIACGSVLTEMVKGKDINHAILISPDDISHALDSLPGEGCTCAALAAGALKAAIRNYIVIKKEPWRSKYSKR